MIAGSLALGGPQVPMGLFLPEATTRVTGNIGARTRGLWTIISDFESTMLNIPTRDKQVQLIAPSFEIATQLSQLDSADGVNYRAKLRSLQGDRADDYHAVVINHNMSTHSSFGVISCVELYVWGLFDQQLEQAYLLWSTDPQLLRAALYPNPARYLIYRFPVLYWDCLFLQIETVCAKWWRWTQHGSILKAFNALERRLLGPLEL